MVSISYVKTVDKFGTRVDPNVKNSRVKFTNLSTRYRVRFIGLGKYYGSDDLTMDMKEFDTPKGSFEDKTIETVNGEIHYPGKWTWSELSFKVYNSYDNANFWALFRQIQEQRDLSEQNTGTVPENYKFVTIFEHTDGHQNGTSYWVMEGCYLTKVEDGANGNNGNHDATTIDCSMRFDNASLYDYNGTLITGRGCDTTYLNKKLATI